MPDEIVATNTDLLQRKSGQRATRGPSGTGFDNRHVLGHLGLDPSIPQLAKQFPVVHAEELNKFCLGDFTRPVVVDAFKYLLGLFLAEADSLR